MNNQSHDELTQIIQTELTELDSTMHPSIKSNARKIRFIAIPYLIIGILFAAVLAWYMQFVFFITPAIAISIGIISLCSALFIILGLVFLLLGSQKALIKRSTKKIVHTIENHVHEPFPFNVSSSGQITLKLKYHTFYFEPDKLHIIDTKVDHCYLLWIPTYFKLFKKHPRSPLVIYCTEERLGEFKQIFSPIITTKVTDAESDL